MRSVKVLFAGGALCALVALVLAGCETGRTNKLHSAYDSASDITTVPHQNPEFASIGTGNPPVPGSPTAAGPDGLQPTNDSGARKSPGAEEGIPAWPRMQPHDRFLRQ